MQAFLLPGSAVAPGWSEAPAKADEARLALTTAVFVCLAETAKKAESNGLNAQ
jgi:hypothetical protein